MKRILLFVLLAMMLTGCRESLEERAAREAETYTEQTCPYKMDQYTTLEKVTFNKATHQFTNEYTLCGDADHELTDEQTTMITQALLEQLRNDTKQKVYQEAGYSYHYVYRSQSNRQTIIFEATFTSADYR